MQVTEYAITVTTNILAARPALAKAIEVWQCTLCLHNIMLLSHHPMATNNTLQKDAPILPATLILLQSALLQGGALSAVINFFAFLGNSYGDPLYAWT
jgi:hypothetical protein